MAVEKTVRVNSKKITKALLDELKESIRLNKIKSSSLKRVGTEFRKEMLSLISKGISPIDGKRFAAYKNPAKYPGDLKRKRPVNLYLTGQQLDSLKIDPITGANPGFVVFYDNEEAQLKEQGHREGVNGQPKRATIPASNQSFSKGLINYLNQLIRNILLRDLEK